MYCSFWTDQDIEDLKPLEKLVYVFLFTNHLTTESGIYQISTKYISERTGITLSQAKEILTSLETHKKITYNNSTIFIYAFMKRNYKGNPEKLQLSILKSFDLYPNFSCWKKFVEVYKNHCISIKIKERLDTLQCVADSPIVIAIGIENSNEDTKQDNNIISNTPAELRKKKEFIIPAFEEFEKYCIENEFGHIADRAYKYYSAADWHDGNGNKIKNWKQKLQGVWFQEKNKINNSPKNFYQPQQALERL